MSNYKIAKIEESLGQLANDETNLADIKGSLVKLLSELSKYIIFAAADESDELIKLYNSIVSFNHKFSQKLKEKIDSQSLNEIYNIFLIDEQIELLAEKVEISELEEQKKIILIKENLQSVINYLIFKISTILEKNTSEKNDIFTQNFSDNLELNYNLMVKKIKNLFEKYHFWAEIENYLKENNIKNIFQRISKKFQENITENINNNKSLSENKPEVFSNITEEKQQEEQNTNITNENSNLVSNLNIKAPEEMEVINPTSSSSIEEITGTSEENSDKLATEINQMAEPTNPVEKENDKLAKILEDLKKKRKKN